MRTIPLTVTARGCVKAPNNAILGRAGELAASRVTFDVAAWTENTITTYSVAGKNAAGTSWVLATGLTASSGIVTLDMPAAMLATAGYAELEIRGEASGTIIKTAAAMLLVEPALTTGTAPENADPAWIDALSQAAETAAAAGKALTLTLTAAGWSSLSQTVTVTGLLANATVLCSPAPSSKATAEAAGVYCSAQAAGSLTFRCTTVPTSAITMNVLALGGMTT